MIATSSEGSQNELITLAYGAAAKYGLEGSLICAIIEQESSWNPWAMRYEPAFFGRYVEPLVLPWKLSATEAHSRATSWGLMQVMGQVAREARFAGEFLSMLCKPDEGMDVGCRVFAAKLAATEGSLEKALDLWNGGAAPDYPRQVLGTQERYRTAVR
ncbi:MAG TPA: lytic transglycosylase domain-containing protein [Candidatus Acidoferrales bacterium]|nr:lytic transglycosylase domain-containing protein [Candidatus Acidoferrales bacterium]